MTVSPAQDAPEAREHCEKLAAVLSAPERFAGRTVAIVCSGGNISPAQLTALWAN